MHERARESNTTTLHPSSLLLPQDKDLMFHLVKTLDKANGYVFGMLNEGNHVGSDQRQSLDPRGSLSVAPKSMTDMIGKVEERYISPFE